MSDPTEFAVTLSHPLGIFYLLAAAANVAAGGCAWKRGNRGRTIAWMAIAVGFFAASVLSFRGSPLELSAGAKTAIDAVCTPAAISLMAFASLVIVFFARAAMVKPPLVWVVFNAAITFLGASLTDPNFFAAVMRPDAVPLVAMVFLLGFFLWLAMYQAVENDRREPLPPVEKEFCEKTLVWPDLVYAELICMIALSAALIVWSLLIRAPLEMPANPAITPNPSKAPWYFVGLQELLTVSDAWNVGIVVPCLAVFGLMAIPYLDRNPSGSGYYSLRGRRFACFVFLFGFLQLWILPILIGTFLRGPNWSSFGLYEAHDAAKLVAIEHRSLAQIFWNGFLGRSLPEASAASNGFSQLLFFLYRDWLGVTLTLLYFLALPPLFARTFFRSKRESLGGVRYYLMMFLLLYLLTLPLKMVAFWLCGIDSFFG